MSPRRSFEDQIFLDSLKRITIKADRMFVYLMLIQWGFGILVAIVVSPYTWIGEQSQVHIHVWMSVILGGVIASLPVFLGIWFPGSIATRHCIAVAQMLFSSLLIHLSGGRIETHFHVFGSLAFLSFYRDWRVLISATTVIALDHFIRGVYFPQTTFGVLASSNWRWIEHAAWVLFEDFFLLYSIRESLFEMRVSARAQSQLTHQNEYVAQQVSERTSQLFEKSRQLQEKVEELNISGQKIQLQKERFESIADNLPIMIAFMDPAKSFRWVNGAFAKELGWGPEEAQNKNLLDAIYPNPVERRRFEEFMAEPRPGVWEPFVIRNKTGASLHTSCSNVHLSTGETIGIWQNITEKKHQQERIELIQKIDKSLSESLESDSHAGADDKIIPSILKIVCEHLGWTYGAFWKVDSISKVLKIENSWAEKSMELEVFSEANKTFQFSRGEGLPGRIWDSQEALFIADVTTDPGFYRAQYAKRANLHSAFGFPVVVGEEFIGIVEFFRQKLEKPDERFLADCGSIGVRIGQVIKKSKAELELRQLLYALDQSALVAITDPKGKIQYANKNFSMITGYSKAELFGNKFNILKSGHHDSAFYENLWETILGRRVWKGQIKNKRKDGTYYWEGSVIVPYADSAGKITHFISIGTDVTMQKNAEEQLDHQRAALAHSAKLSSLGEMAGGIAHEINNPLTVIQGKASQLRRSILGKKHDEASAIATLEKIESTAGRIGKIIKGLKSFSRNAEKDPFETVPISKVLDETLEFCVAKFKSHAIDLECLCPENLEIECQPTQLSQVILNLLQNAFDAVQTLSIKWVRIDVSEKNGETIEMRVTDSGSGIAKEIAQKIMLPFFTTKEVGKGTGLGLSISKGILENHGGTIVVDHSSMNTCFLIRLPKRQGQTHKMAA